MIRIASLVLAISLAAVGNAGAQTKITLRVADFYPIGNKIPEFATKPWMKRVTEASGGQVEFEYYPAQQLGKAKDLMSLALSGAVDVAGFATSYVSDKMPLSAVAELPGGANSSCGGTLAYWKLAKDGLLHDVEYAPNGLRLLFVVVNPPFQLYLTKSTLSSLKDIEGMKIRTTGGAQDATVRQLKGVPVRMAGPDINTALSRGTLDGLLFPVTSLFSYDLPPLLKSGTHDQNFGTGVLPYAMSEARWQQLPESVRKVLLEVGEETTRSACASMDKSATPEHERVRKAGVNLVDLSDATRDALMTELSTVKTQWAQALEKSGKPGMKVLQAYEAARKSP